MNEITIRDAVEADFSCILELNLDEVEKTSAMDMERLKALDRLACYHRVALMGDEVVAFLLAMRDGVDYRNDNYAWFAERYSRFLYVDRIVVGEAWLGLRIGGALYRDLFVYAKTQALECIACEYNIAPPNPASKRFHDRFGFKEVGRKAVAGSRKQVSLQRLAL